MSVSSAPTPAVHSAAQSSKPSKIITKLALKGGGARGYEYIGVAKALEELGYLKVIDGVSGSSAGAISALLFATGLPVAELTAIMDKANISEMVYAEYKWEEAWNLFDKKGLHQGLGFVKWFGEIIEQVTGSKDTTFAQWNDLKMTHPEKNMKDLIVEACNMNIGFNEIFSHDSKYKDVPIRHAVRASMAFPEFFTPWYIHYTDPLGMKKVNLFQDGGLQSNCPVGVFNLPGNKANPEALAIWLATQDIIDFVMEDKPLPETEIDHQYQLIEATVNASVNTQTYAIMNSPYQKSTVLCSTLDVGTLDFNIDNKKKQALAQSGYDAIMKYFGHKIQPHPVLETSMHAELDGKAEATADEVATLGQTLANLALVPAHAAYSLGTYVVSPITWMFSGSSSSSDQPAPGAPAVKKERQSPQ